MKETWRSVVGYEGRYIVSSLGRVKSLDRTRRNGSKWRGRILKQSEMPSGYKVVSLWKDNKQKTALVHRLVLFAFVGESPPGHETRHLDGNPANNSTQNLAWGTPTKNNQDIVNHGRNANASKTHCPKGHPYDSENTYFHKGAPHRQCKACHAEYGHIYQREYRRRKKLSKESLGS